MNKKLLVVVAFFILFKKWRGSSFQPSRDEFVASKKQMAPSLLPFSFMAVRLGKFSANCNSWLHLSCKALPQWQQLVFLLSGSIDKDLVKLCVFTSEMMMNDVRRDKVKHIFPHTLFLSPVGNKELRAGIYGTR